MGLEGTDTAIQWSNFNRLEQPPVGKDYDAETASQFSLEYLLVRKGNAVVVKSADVKVFINTDNSWAVIGKRNDYLLKHEQGHYDITAIAAKEFYSGLMELTAKDKNALQEKIRRLNHRLQKKIDNSNILYDEQTDHSRNKSAQGKWNKALETEKRKAGSSLDNLP